MKRALTLFLAIVMILSVFPMSVFAAENVITAIDTDGLVMETVFAYNNSADTTSRWSSLTYNEVTNPTFYPTLTATVDGVEQEIDVE